jgi:hypothetical protein
VRCGCAACQSLIDGAGRVAYDEAAAARHYIAALSRFVAGLRRLDRAARARELGADFDRTAAAVEKVNAAPPGSPRLDVKRRLNEWKAALL